MSHALPAAHQVILREALEQSRAAQVAWIEAGAGRQRVERAPAFGAGEIVVGRAEEGIGIVPVNAGPAERRAAGGPDLRAQRQEFVPGARHGEAVLAEKLPVVENRPARVGERHTVDALLHPPGFQRARQEAVAPGSVALPIPPGQKRPEVAQLAGVHERRHQQIAGQGGVWKIAVDHANPDFVDIARIAVDFDLHFRAQRLELPRRLLVELDPVTAGEDRNIELRDCPGAESANGDHDGEQSGRKNALACANEGCHRPRQHGLQAEARKGRCVHSISPVSLRRIWRRTAAIFPRAERLPCATYVADRQDPERVYPSHGLGRPRPGPEIALR